MGRRQNWVAITRHCLFEFMSSSPRLMQAEEKGTRNGELLALWAHPGGVMSVAEIVRRFWLSRKRLRKIVGHGHANARNSGGRRWQMCLQWRNPFTAWLSGMKRGQRPYMVGCANEMQQEPKIPLLTFRSQLCGRTSTRKAFQSNDHTRFCSRTCQSKRVVSTLLGDGRRLRPVAVENWSGRTVPEHGSDVRR